MKYLLTALAAIAGILLAGCNKDREPAYEDQPVKLIELNNYQVLPGKYFHLDLDSNGTTDFTVRQSEFFSVIEQAYKLEFHINSYRQSFVLAPMDYFLPAMPEGEVIKKRADRNRQWCNSSQLNFVRKTTVPATNNIAWEGTWINQSHKFIPVKLTGDGNRIFIGWIEASMNIETEIITLHRAALTAGEKILSGIE